MKFPALFMLLVLSYILSPMNGIAVEERSSLFNVDDRGLALQGYDAVSYFSGTPLLGRSNYIVVHKGLSYWFVNRENMNTFASRPEKYLPAYGGWCAWAMLEGEQVKVNPERYKIIDGINYLFYDGFWGNTLKKWNTLGEKETEPSLIRKSAVNWQRIIAR